MKSKTSKHGLKRMTALLLAVVLCVGMVPTAFAAQQDSYHDPAEHWQDVGEPQRVGGVVSADGEVAPLCL